MLHIHVAPSTVNSLLETAVHIRISIHVDIRVYVRARVYGPAAVQPTLAKLCRQLSQAFNSAYSDILIIRGND